MDPISFIVMIAAYLLGKEISRDKPAKKKPDDDDGDSQNEPDRPFFQIVKLRDKND
jgi:hypothetical protein